MKSVLITGGNGYIAKQVNAKNVSYMFSDEPRIKIVSIPTDINE